MYKSPILIYGYKITIADFLRVFGSEFKDSLEISDSGLPISKKDCGGDKPYSPDTYTKRYESLKEIGQFLNEGNRELVEEVFLEFIFEEYKDLIWPIWNDDHSIHELIYGKKVTGNSLDGLYWETTSGNPGGIQCFAEHYRGGTIVTSLSQLLLDANTAISEKGVPESEILKSERSSTPIQEGKFYMKHESILSGKDIFLHCATD